MKSGENGLIGPGSNDYGRADKLEIQRELTPELANKIWKSMQKKIYDEKVSKEAVLHHLKQLKAQMGKLAKISNSTSTVHICMDMIDKKINKIKSK